MAVDKLVDSTQLDADLASVADAIRAKGGTSAQLAFPSEFVSAIGDISTGGGGLEQKQINFIDYDGTLLHSYSKEEFSQLSELPANPSHTGLTAQGWNWTKQQITDQLTACPSGLVWVGQMYITESGKTEIDFTLQAQALSPYLVIGVNGTVSVNWGDGSAEDTVTGTSITSLKYTQHTYSTAGNYTITIEAVSGSFSFYCSSSSQCSILTIAIGNSAYRASATYSSNITSIRLGSGITILHEYCFNKLYSLETITIPSGVTELRQYALYGLYNLKAVVLPNTVTSIGNSVVANALNLKKISIPIGITSFGNSVFNSCYKLESATIPISVVTIGNNLFYNCYKLKSAAFPRGVTSIGTYACYNCYALKSVVISDSITSIGDDTFYCCYELETVDFSNNSVITSLPDYMFYSCYKLKSIAFPSSVTSLGANAVSNCYGLTSVEIPNTVINIGGSAFNSCSSLKHVTLGNGVTTLGTYVFANCLSITNLTIPSGVTTIGNYAFQYCSGMTEYHFLSDTPPALGGTSVFSNALQPSLTVIYVPYSADHSILNAYKTAANWTSVSSDIQEEPQ